VLLSRLKNVIVCKGKVKMLAEAIFGGGEKID